MRRSNKIGTIIDDGKKFSEEEDKKQYFWYKFKELYALESHVPNSIGDWSGLFLTKRVTNPNLLTILFVMEEIKTVVFQLGGDKVPGPDSFSLSFYQTFWDIVKNDIFLIYQALYEGRVSIRAVDYTYFCLIPKKKGGEGQRL